MVQKTQKEKKMKVANRNLAELTPYAGNAKKHDSTQIANVAESIKQFGDEQERLFKERMARGKISEEDEEYQAFLEKFEAKKTTDDCYTPDNIYDAVKKWCIERYGLSGKKIIRPFYPGGDYQKEDCSGDCVVLDNPPFSIISEIISFYNSRGMKFFLFAPALTLLSPVCDGYCGIAVGASITYENGAKVSTSFATNVESNVAMTSP